VDREALYAIMRAKGADDGMVRWVRLLLSDTRAMAKISGHMSRPRCWEAGVRQGCPLSPLLYLFVAEALACWLRQSPALGVQVQGERYVSAHHADDTKVVVESLEAGLIDNLLGHMATFGDATGQRVNAAKSCAVPLGSLLLGTAGQTQAIPVSDTIVCLGVVVAPVPVQELQLVARPGLRRTIQEPPPPAAREPASPEWDRRITTVRNLGGMVCGLTLSAMGRGMAVSAYATTKVCFHAEHEGLPARYEEELRKVLVRVVDRHGMGRVLPGVPSDLLPGSPSAGGFGLLPIGQHVAARHVKWTGRLLLALCEIDQDEGQAEAPPVWVHLARMLLQRVCPTLHPAQALLLAAFSTPVHGGQGRLTGVDSQRLLVPDGPLRRMCVALQRMGHLHLHPGVQGEDMGGGVHAWLQCMHAPADVCRLVPSLVWACQLERPVMTALGPCRALTVKEVTALLMTKTETDRQRRHEAFAAQALATSQLTAASKASRTRTFMRGWRTVWRVPWENPHKEVFWRLAVNGVAGAGGGGICFARPCLCGGGMLTAHQHSVMDSTPHRQHAFWDCPVAQRVVQQLRRALGNRALSQWNVWLLQPPRDVCCAVWRVVALAALEAMETGRKTLWREWNLAGAPDEDEEPAAARRAKAAAVESAGQRAAAAFWLALHDFARGGRSIPSRGWDRVGVDHPFLAASVRPPLLPVFVVVVPEQPGVAGVVQG
jgi:hypothetical protein